MAEMYVNVYFKHEDPDVHSKLVRLFEMGDVNSDGYSDVIIGAYRYDNGQTDEGREYQQLVAALRAANWVRARGSQNVSADAALTFLPQVAARQRGRFGNWWTPLSGPLTLRHRLTRLRTVGL